ncbi:hypothetical protein FDP41_010850 [Naegleria fowleri]|uniref:Uncharacterized protein n=1 Tax=Naegleria fowleri TaxID=5763 RepID=A0A6A5C6Y7_NAEFO|nr:uncharacterized protein FDP41_010850 [Naegleria fowleri]KAF0982871.1 hypothetical protein FDP41_010850 [Naegleria fowleri]CAG4709155.1 unnamed protein product [Naegleria fowleri]
MYYSNVVNPQTYQPPVSPYSSNTTIFEAISSSNLRFGSESASELVLSQYSLSKADIDGTLSQLNSVLAPHYEISKSYTLAYLIILGLSIALAIPTMGLSMFPMIIIILMMQPLQQSRITNSLEQRVKPSLREIIKRENETKYLRRNVELFVEHKGFMDIVSNGRYVVPRMVPTIEIYLKPLQTIAVVQLPQQNLAQISPTVHQQQFMQPSDHNYPVQQALSDDHK